MEPDNMRHGERVPPKGGSGTAPSAAEIERHKRLAAAREELQASMREEVAKLDERTSPGRGRTQAMTPGMDYQPTTAAVLVWMAVGFFVGLSFGSTLTTLLWVLLQK